MTGRKENNIECPACKKVMVIPGDVEDKLVCVNCGEVLVRPKITFISLVIKMFVSLLLMNVCFGAVLVYFGVSVNIAGAVGLILSFLLLYVWVRNTGKWATMRNRGQSKNS